MSSTCGDCGKKDVIGYNAAAVAVSEFVSCTRRFADGPCPHKKEASMPESKFKVGDYVKYVENGCHSLTIGEHYYVVHVAPAGAGSSGRLICVSTEKGGQSCGSAFEERFRHAEQPLVKGGLYKVYTSAGCYQGYARYRTDGFFTPWVPKPEEITDTACHGPKTFSKVELVEEPKALKEVKPEPWPLLMRVGLYSVYNDLGHAWWDGAKFMYAASISIGRTKSMELAYKRRADQEYTWSQENMALGCRPVDTPPESKPEPEPTPTRPMVGMHRFTDTASEWYVWFNGSTFGNSGSTPDQAYQFRHQEETSPSLRRRALENRVKWVEYKIKEAAPVSAAPRREVAAKRPKPAGTRRKLLLL